MPRFACSGPPQPALQPSQGTSQGTSQGNPLARRRTVCYTQAAIPSGTNRSRTRWL